jgi:hypothetical protein
MRSLRPSIAIADFDDAVENHLVGKINDLGPPSGNPEEDDDRIEALRSDLHGAIAKVLADHGITVVASRAGAVAHRSVGP